jgi:hypothetical protein
VRGCQTLQIESSTQVRKATRRNAHGILSQLRRIQLYELLQRMCTSQYNDRIPPAFPTVDYCYCVSLNVNALPPSWA